MKTAFSLVLPTVDYPELLAAVAEAGFDGVEPTFHPNGIPSPERFRDEATALRKESDRLGLTIPSLRGGPLFWPLFGSANPKDRRRAVELARQALEALKDIGYNSWLSAEFPLPETGRQEFLKETVKQLRQIWSGTI